MELPNHDFHKDIEHVSKIPIVPMMLNVICQSTGMNFVAIARVTEDRWVTCSVLDNLAFGLLPGSELEIRTTICDEIRKSSQWVIIDNVDEDSDFCEHHTPKLYGFKSYISVPIIRKDGRFFGTLCAIDSKPNKLSTPDVIGMFTLFAELVAFHLDALEQLELSEKRLAKRLPFSKKLELEIKARTKMLEEKNTALEKKNAELQAVLIEASRSLQRQVQKIEVFASRIAEKDIQNLSPYDIELLNRIEKSVHRMQSKLADLLSSSSEDVPSRR
jgi:GAF domain-containing protein